MYIFLSVLAALVATPFVFALLGFITSSPKVFLWSIVIGFIIYLIICV